QRDQSASSSVSAPGRHALPPPPPASRTTDGATARRALITTAVAVAVVVGALALWKLRVVVALLFIAFILAAAMRPGVEAMARRRIPRAVGVVVHYLVFFALVAALLAF